MKNNAAYFAIAALAVLAFANSAEAQPDLKPFQPSGWSGSVVVGTNDTATNYAGSFSTTNTLYVSWAVINNGNQSVNTSFNVTIYVDGGSPQSWTIPSLPSGFYEYVIGAEIGSLSAGTHSVSVVADSGDMISNDNHSDDSATNTFTVLQAVLAAPALYTPTNGITGQPEVPWFSWSPVAAASGYRVLIATNPLDLPSATSATNGGSSVLLDDTTLTTNFSPTITLSPNTTYFWEVHAISGSTDSGIWSGIGRFATGPAGSGVTIIPDFDSTIASDPNAATIEATINAAISVYRQNFSDAVTAHFTFTETNSGLGLNTTFLNYYNYSSYLTALTNHATTADDATALAQLPSGPDNPVNGNSQMSLNLPLARALGFGGNPPGGSDSTIYLNTSIMNLSSFSTDANSYSLFSTVSHEMDEALGLGSALNGLTNGAPAPTGPLEPEDLFRYDGSGHRSLTTALNATSYFSLDGTTDLAQFNQFDGGDFGDWYSYNVSVVPQVQDAFLLNGVNPVLGVELRALDVIGYTRVTTAMPVVVAQLSNPAVSGTNFQFSLSGLIGSNYVVQVSSNLTTWTPVSTNAMPTSATVQITNSFSKPADRYFRAALQ